MEPPGSKSGTSATHHHQPTNQTGRDVVVGFWGWRVWKKKKEEEEGISAVCVAMADRPAICRSLLHFRAMVHKCEGA